MTTICYHFSAIWFCWQPKTWLICGTLEQSSVVRFSTWTEWKINTQSYFTALTQCSRNANRTKTSASISFLTSISSLNDSYMLEIECNVGTNKGTTEKSHKFNRKFVIIALIGGEISNITFSFEISVFKCFGISNSRDKKSTFANVFLYYFWWYKAILWW